jgi:5-oxoprolinase (ATP-hydrolysing) subunit A
MKPDNNDKNRIYWQLKVDFNCDMGEGIGNDEAIMPYISSANIACGYHAGDEDTMKKTVELAAKYNVNVGAHPSFADRENFGRTDMWIPFQQVYDMVTAQINLLDKIARSAGLTPRHVKPHGALYNMAARAWPLAAVVALAIKDVNDKLILYGLSGSHLISEAKKIGLKACNEVFADRTYINERQLTPRHKPNALIENEEQALQQVMLMIEKNEIITTGGQTIPIIAETICIHGDGKNAVTIAKKISGALKGE